VAQDCYVIQYITPKQRVHLTPETIVQLYEVFQDDMPDDLRQLHNEVDRWKARWDMTNVAERPDTINNTIQEINPDLYFNLYTSVVILMVCTALYASNCFAS